MKYRPVVLIIMDGWGVAPPSAGNCVESAAKPNFDKLAKEYFCATLGASGEAVGLPWCEIGNSEVGHQNLGAGKIVTQDLPRITNSIKDGSFYKNKEFLAAIEHAKKNRSKLHLFGVLGPGGVHAHEQHLYALLEVAKAGGLSEVLIHLFLDGRDTPPRSAEGFLEVCKQEIKRIGIGTIVSLVGRHFAMDRDHHWDRIEKAYKLLTEGKGASAVNFTEAIQRSYERQIFDQYIEPIVLEGKTNGSFAAIQDNDAVIFYNFRPDRAIQLSQALTSPDFKGFSRRLLKNLYFVGLTQYDSGLPIKVAFPPVLVQYPIARIISEANLKQLHMAETEKFAHVTVFFNGGREEPFPGEDRILVQSPYAERYDERPEMAASEVAEKALREISKGKYSFVVINFANPDMVGHTGNLPAIREAVSTVDKCLGRLVPEIVSLGGAAVITADHGNAESKIDLETGELTTDHTINPVPLIIAARDFINEGSEIVAGKKPTGVLGDVAPTLIDLMGLKRPPQMDGVSFAKNG